MRGSNNTKNYGSGQPSIGHVQARTHAHTQKLASLTLTLRQVESISIFINSPFPSLLPSLFLSSNFSISSLYH